MNKMILALGLSLLSNTLVAQTRGDSIRLVRSALAYYDLSFTEAEADSMLGSLEYHRRIYQRMHQFFPPNDLTNRRKPGK